jgi:hypothetical protein
VVGAAPASGLWAGPHRQAAQARRQARKVEP